MDFHLLALYKNFNFPVIFTRAANVYGPKQKLYRIIPKTIISILNGQNFYGGKIKKIIHRYMMYQRHYGKLVKGIIGSTYHISTDKLISIKELVRLICKKMNKNFDELVEIKENTGKDLAYKLSSSKLKEN